MKNSTKSLGPIARKMRYRTSEQGPTPATLLKYGMTLEDYEKMFEAQGKVCAICKKYKSRALVIDHDHSKGPTAVRGLLCTWCNYMLGFFRDNPKKFECAAEYLRKADVPKTIKEVAKKTGRPTFEELCVLEPELLKLLREAQAVHDAEVPNTFFCANDIWYRSLKPRLYDLVGWHRKHVEILGSCVAYDVAYRTVYNALPDCRRCGCFQMWRD